MSLKLFVLLTLVASMGLSAPILTPQALPCNLFGIGPLNDISIPYSVWTDPGFACQQQDKIFSGFSVTGPVPPTTVLELQMQVLGPLDLHTVTFNGNFLLGFDIAYDITVDPASFPLKRIVRVSADLSNPSIIGEPVNTKSVFTESGVLLGVISSLTRDPGLPLIVDETALHVLDSYQPNGGAAVSISNTFDQKDVETPEIVSIIMMVSGLLLIRQSRRMLS